MMNQAILIEIENAIAHLRLNRPQKHNALDMAMFEALAQAQKRLSREAGLRAVILSGEGVDFCSGLDVKSMMKNRKNMVKLLWKWLPGQSNLAQLVSTGWRKLPVPVIASVHGRCWGGGLQIALGADFRMVHPEASLSIMEGKWGLIPDMGGSLALRELMSRDQAAKLAMTAETISGTEAFDLGLVTRIEENPLDAARTLAAELLERSPDAIAAVKRLYRKSWSGSNAAALARETFYQIRILSGRNQRIAVSRQLGGDKEYQRARKW
jgi:enoyl-CoA hydratase/carnithine racemase